VRILLVVHGFPPEEQSGTELYASSLTAALASAGHDVAVFAGSHSATAPLHEERPAEGFDVERFARPRARVRYRYHDSPTEEALLAAVERFGPDVVHVHHLLGLTLPVVTTLRRLGIPVVLTLHDHWLLCPEIQPYRPGAHRLGDSSCFVHLELLRPRRLASMLVERDLRARLRAHGERARLVRAELAAADVVLAPSRFLAGRFGAVGATVLTHGIEPVTRLPRAASGSVTYGYLGPLIHGKGPDLLLRAFRGLRDPSARLVVHGAAPDDRYARRIRQLAARDARVSVAPPLPREELAAFFARIDVLVVPSRLHESFSLVVREAFSAGVPVVASDAGALPESGAVCFRSGSVRDLRAKLRHVPDGALPAVKTMAAHAAELGEVYARLAQPRAKYARARSRSVAS
jgi:glycosyltransferase involved in cell wall biosynthesis